MGQQVNKAIEQNESKSQEMKTSQGFRQTFIVPREASKAAEPTKTALDDPSAREQDETALGVRQLDDFELNAKLSRVLQGLLTGVSLVDKSNLHCLARGFLDLARELLNLLAVLFVGGRDTQSQQMAQGVDRHVNLAAFLALGPIIPGPRATFGAGLQRPAVEIAAEGRAFLPSASLNISLKSCTIASNTPALSQRWPC